MSRSRIAPDVNAYLMLNHGILCCGRDGAAVEVELTALLPVMDDALDALKHLRRWMRPHWIWPTLTTLGTKARVLFQPRGRCLIVGPRNYPLKTVPVPLVSAVAAGNTAILKPSEFTRHVNAVVASVVAEVFMPTRSPSSRAPWPRRSACYRCRSITSSSPAHPPVAKFVMAAAAKNLASVTLELGGKSPAIVDEGADVEAAAN